MTLKHYLCLMATATILCWIAWLFVILNLDPAQASWLVFFFFYLSLFLALIGTISVVGFLIKQRLLKDAETVFRHVKRTFRQSILISLLAILLLYLLQIHLLAWWNGLAALTAVILIEILLFGHRQHNSHNYV